MRTLAEELKRLGLVQEEKKPQLNKPFRTPEGPKKFAVYVKNQKTGEPKKVTFGDPDMEIKRDDPERRKNFRARHGCDNPGPKDKAKYWSCKFWSTPSVSKLLGQSVDEFGIPLLEDEENLLPEKEFLEMLDAIYQDRMTGGQGDEKKPSDFPIDAVLKGIASESEHTDDMVRAIEIAIDHLTADGVDYYDKLAEVEK